MTPLVSVVIPNYNGADYLPDCLKSCLVQSFTDAEYIVVDNGSTDKSAEILRRDFPSVRAVFSKTNLGFAGGCNLGAKAASGKWIVFLNNDTVLERDWLEQLIQMAQSNEKIGACTSKIRIWSDRNRLDAIGSYMTPAGFLTHIGLLETDQGQHDHLKEISFPKGVSFAFRRDLFEGLRGFDESYFAYFEESDLFWRLWLSGYRIAFAPKSIVYHKVGGTSTRFPNAFVDYHSFKNRIQTIIKNTQGTTLLWMLPLHLLCCLGLALVSLFQPKRWSTAGSILKAIGWNILHLPSTLRARKRAQQERRISDREFFKEALRPIPFGVFAKYTWYLVFTREKNRERVHKGSGQLQTVKLKG